MIGRVLVVVLIVLVVFLQYGLWFGDGGLLDLWRLNQSIVAQEEENAQLRERNAALEAEVRDLKQGLEAVEERARSELGMIGESETFYLIVDPPQ